MNWIAVSSWYYRLFTALTIYNGTPPLFFFFGMSQIVQLRKHIHELPNWSANMKIRNVETITHKFLSKPFKTKTPKCQTFLQFGIQAKRFSSKYFHRFPISIDKNHLILNDFYRFRFLSIDYSGSYGSYRM